MTPSAFRIAEARAAFDRFKEVEFNCGHFDWSKACTFKYVLIELKSKVLQDTKLLVRGMTSAEYHADSAEPTLRQIDASGFCHRVIGGGRIKYKPGSPRSMMVYGYSIGFPWPNGEFKNELVATIIRRNFQTPHQQELVADWSNEGY